MSDEIKDAVTKEEEVSAPIPADGGGSQTPATANGDSNLLPIPTDGELNPIPVRYRFLSGSMLKLIACITMLIDHIGSNLVPHNGPVLFKIRSNTYNWYQIYRSIGRIAFPLFCFLMVEGFLHTSNRFRYGRNLLIFAIISELPWNLVHNNTIFLPGSQSVFVTLFLGYLGMCAIHYLRDNVPRMSLALIGLMGVSYVIHCDYGMKGFCLLIALYLLHKARIFQVVVGCGFLNTLTKSGIGFFATLFYNGQRGFIRGRWKYAFYAFYPVHLLVLWMIKYKVLG